MFELLLTKITGGYLSFVLFLHVTGNFLSDRLLNRSYLFVVWLQPHGFFNCSPAVDVPPNVCELDTKDNDIKENMVPKSIQNGLLAKL